tara:strand:- start:25 stop:630 length:606 start_codon:yes stop_codon:yes gene_type:complete
MDDELENKEVERLKVEITDGDTLAQEKSDNDFDDSFTPVKKTKKIRSEKQIAAFEKAKIKRAANIAFKKLEKDTLKKEKKEAKTKIKETSIIDSLPADQKEMLRVKATEDNQPKYRPTEIPQYQHSQGHYQHQPQPIINNYYYGAHNQPQGQIEKVQDVLKEEKSKQIIYESSSEEEDYYEEEIIDNNLVPTNSTLKYKFV